MRRIDVGACAVMLALLHRTILKNYNNFDCEPQIGFALRRSMSNILNNYDVGQVEAAGIAYFSSV